MQKEGRRVGNVINVSGLRPERDRRSDWARLLEASPDLVFVTDCRGVIEYANPAFERATGYDRSEVIGQTPALFRSGQHDARFYRRLWRTLLNGEAFQACFVNRRKNGTEYYEEKTLTPIRAADGSVTHFLSTGKDVTERVHAERRLGELAYHDPLTGLPNRHLLEDRLGQALARAQRAGQGVGVLFLDLDHFKPVNDALGHAVGDALLKAAAKRLQSCVRDGDTVARLGGDEFVVLLDPVTQSSDAAAVADKLLEALERPFQLQGHEVLTSVSIGISLYPDGGTDAAALLKQADDAMYRAKRSGRHGYQFQTPDIQDRVRETLDLERRLAKALSDQALVLGYQPLLDLHNGHIVALEAQAQWRDPVLNDVPQDELLTLAEGRGMMGEIGDWLLTAVLRQMAEWRRSGCQVPYVTLQVCGRRFSDAAFAADLLARLEAAEVAPAQLELTIGGKALTRSTRGTRRNLQTLAAQGVRIALDDFGAQDIALTELGRYPFSSLKLSRSLVDGVDRRPREADLVAAAVALGHALRLPLVARGVTREAQRECLRRLGCDLGQGAALAAPLTPTVVTTRWQPSAG